MIVIHLSSRHSAAADVATQRAEDWRSRAACVADGVDPDLFFPDERLPLLVRLRMERQAKTICARCPVLQQCRAYGVQEGWKYGVWGGTAERDRRSVSRKPSLERAIVVRRAGRLLAVERGREVIDARLRGASDADIAAWARVDVAAARLALRILLPPPDAHTAISRRAMMPVERALLMEEPLRVLARGGRTNAEIGRTLRLAAETVDAALRVLDHRDAALAATRRTA